MSQAALAAAAGVSRRWLTGLEAGKETAEVGLVLKTLYALDLVLDAQPRENLASAGIDLDELLASLDDG